MTLALALETASSPFGVVFGENKNVLFNSVEDASLRDSRDIPLLVEQGLTALGRPAGDIGAIAVNIGPGGLSSVRSGVALANALAFGLKIPVFPFTSLELMGLEAWRKFQRPVLCTARAVQGKAYAGLYHQGAITTMRFGLLENIIPEIIGALRAFVGVGPYRTVLREFMPDCEIHDGGIQRANAAVLFDLMPDAITWGNRMRAPVLPINEYSTTLHESGFLPIG